MDNDKQKTKITLKERKRESSTDNVQGKSGLGITTDNNQPDDQLKEGK